MSFKEYQDIAGFAVAPYCVSAAWHAQRCGSSTNVVKTFDKNTGVTIWWKSGVIHRDGGPAVIYANGTAEWVKQDKLHREDGPAIEWTDGKETWIISGVPVFSFKDFQKASGCSDEHIMAMMLKYGPIHSMGEA